MNQQTIRGRKVQPAEPYRKEITCVDHDNDIICKFGFGRLQNDWDRPSNQKIRYKIAAVQWLVELHSNSPTAILPLDFDLVTELYE